MSNSSKHHAQNSKLPSFAVDGSNLLRLSRWQEPNLATLLTVLNDLCDHAADVVCIFDASTPHWFIDGKTEESSSIYAYLLQRHPRHFYQCTAGVRADDIVLAEADAVNAIVVSNDMYRDYSAKFPWLCQRDRMIRVNRFRENVYIGRTRTPTVRDLQAAATELDAKLRALAA